MDQNFMESLEKWCENNFSCIIQDAPNYNLRLRRLMIDRIKGSTNMKVKIHHDEMKRVFVRENLYSFVPIANTPFSLGIAVPKTYGLYHVEGNKTINDVNVNTLFEGVDWTLHPTWDYCRLRKEITKGMNVTTRFKFYLDLAKNKSKLFEDKCDKHLIHSTIFDAVVTSWLDPMWIKDDDETLGVELVFVGTRSGFTRFWWTHDQGAQNATDPGFIENHALTIEELYYKRAADAGEGTFIFSVPFDSGMENNHTGKTIVTASSAVTVSDGQHDVSPVAAVVGYQMEHEHYAQIFKNIVTSCRVDGKLLTSGCPISCSSEDNFCYLLDDNGFVIVSDRFEEVGKFFGDIDGHAMYGLVEADVYKAVSMYDYQGMVEVCPDVNSTAARLLTPFTQIPKFFIWIVQRIAMYILTIDVAALYHNLQAWAQQVTDSGATTPTSDIFMGLEPVKNGSNITDGEGGDDDDADSGEVPLEEEIKCQYKSVETTFRLFYKGDVAHVYRVVSQPCSKTESKKRKIIVYPVPNTNLKLVMIYQKDYCDEKNPLYKKDLSGANPIVPETIARAEVPCKQMTRTIYRNAPDMCYSNSPLEDTTKCGRGSCVLPSMAQTITILLLSTLATNKLW